MSTVDLPGYQETEVGSIPATWTVQKIGEMTEVSAGGTPATGIESYWSPAEVSWMSSGEVHKRRIYSTEKKISTLGLNNSAAKVFPKKSVVMALAGQGKTRGCVAVLEAEVATNQSLAAIYPSEAFDTDFLFHNLDWRYKELRALSSGEGGRGGLNLSIIKSVPIGLPPLSEQKKVAAILSAVDDKLDVIARQIDANHTLKQGLMQTLFSRGVGTQTADGRWVPHVEFKDSELGEIPAGWSVRSLGSVTEEVRERNSGKLEDALLCGVLKEQGLVPMRERVKGATTERCRVVHPRAFAYNPMRINIGSIARNLRDHSVMVSPDYVVFATRSEVLLPGYLDHFRRSDEWQRFVGRSGDGGVRIRIYYDDLAQLRMKVPPLSEQVKVVEILDCMTTKLKQLIVRQDEFQKLKRGLMQKLLTGEWRVSLDARATET